MNVLALTTILAPYRVHLYRQLGTLCKITACFEQKTDVTRSQEWYETDTEGFTPIYLKHWDRSPYRVRFDVLQYLTKDVDVVLLNEFSTPTAMLFMMACLKKNVPYCISCDGAFLNTRFVRTIVKRYFVSRAAKCLANGESAREYFLHYGASSRQIEDIYFTSLFESDILAKPPSLEEKQALRRRLNLEARRIVITVGRFIPLKRIEDLILSWQSAAKDDLLVIIGGGDCRPKYASMIEELGLDNVRVLDFIQSEKLREYYMAADLFAFPSSLDVWGLVVNEAMACGLPVVSSHMGIAGRELVKDGENGFVVPVADVDALTRSIHKIMVNDGLRCAMAENAIRTIMPYTYENNALSHYKIFSNLNCGHN